MEEKILLFPLLLGTACVISGLYGAIHNQISYTVSPDYFHAFKFRQFEIPEPMQNRLGAAIVGWRASWWMGIFIGLPLLLVGMILPGWKAYLSRSLIAFAIVAATALVVGLWALVHGSFTITEASALVSWAPQGVVDKVAFARAGTMHNYSYLGGFIGILKGSVFLIMERSSLARTATEQSAASDSKVV